MVGVEMEWQNKKSERLKADTLEMEQQKGLIPIRSLLLGLPVWPQSDQSTRLLQELSDLLTCWNDSVGPFVPSVPDGITAQNSELPRNKHPPRGSSVGAWTFNHTAQCFFLQQEFYMNICILCQLLLETFFPLLLSTFT